MHQGLLFLILVFLPLNAVFAQDTTLQLREVDVRGLRLSKFSTGIKTETLDSAVLQRFAGGNLADLFAQNNALFIKSYSPGNLSTPSFRGTGASHTAVLWNGFNLQSPMNGQVDFALLPAGFTDQVQVQYGGAGALFGSGAVGGTIHLNNLPAFGRGLTVKLNSSAASFSDYRQDAAVAISARRWVSSLKVFNVSDRNNFTYINPNYPQTVQRQTNAAIHQQGFLLENYVRLSAGQILNFHYWFQQSRREVPPTLEAGSQTKDFQNDIFHRFSSQWQRSGQKAVWEVRAALFTETIRFTRPTATDSSQNTAITFISEAENTLFMAKGQSLKTGINYTYTHGSGRELPSGPSLDRLSFFAAYKLSAFQDKWKASATLREQWNGNHWAPLTPGFGVEGNIYKDKVKFSANATRTYRLPTFNELYWQEGLTQGNPGLLPETGWSEDAGAIIQLKKEKKNSALALVLKGNVFNNNVNNWIYWHTNSNGVLGVDNLLAVWSRGAEVNLKLQRQSNRLLLYAEFNATYTVSTIENTDAKNAATLGKQLIYVPYNTFYFNTGAQWKGWSLHYNHSFNGFRYTSEDNSSFLPAYQLGNLYGSFETTLAGLRCRLYAKANNIWNQSYEVMASRPMPLSSYQFGISVQFNKPLSF